MNRALKYEKTIIAIESKKHVERKSFFFRKKISLIIFMWKKYFSMNPTHLCNVFTCTAEIYEVDINEIGTIAHGDGLLLQRILLRSHRHDLS